MKQSEFKDIQDEITFTVWRHVYLKLMNEMRPYSLFQFLIIQGIANIKSQVSKAYYTLIHNSLHIFSISIILQSFK